MPRLAVAIAAAGVAAIFAAAAYVARLAYVLWRDGRHHD